MDSPFLFEKWRGSLLNKNSLQKHTPLNSPKNMNFLTSRAKPILLLQKPTSKTNFISLFTTTATPPPPRATSSSDKNARVSVWWDIENCGVPKGGNVNKVVHSITEALRVNGVMGPLQIHAFGDVVVCISRFNQHALSSLGVNLIHIPHGGKDSADKSLLVNLMCWVSQNPPPAHIFLISDDSDFAGTLHKLKMRNYNILLAAREPNRTLCSAASVLWNWSDLTKGKNLLGTRLNQPFDEPCNSESSAKERCRDIPEEVFKQSHLTKGMNLLGKRLNHPINKPFNFESSARGRCRDVPEEVLRQLRSVVNSHREGLWIGELRRQLKFRKVVFDKGFYGYKTFSQFLKAFPRIVKVEPHANGQFFLRPASADDDDFSAQSMPVNGLFKTSLFCRGDDKIGKVEASRDFIVKIINWCSFWRNESYKDKLIEIHEIEPRAVKEDAKELDVVPRLTKFNDDYDSRGGKHVLSTTLSHLKALRFFLMTQQGSDIVLNSLSREQIVEGVLKEGPSILKHLEAIQIRLLVDSLLAEGNTKDFPMENARFRLVFPVVPKNPPEKSSNEIMADCHNLLDKVLTQSPEGYDLLLFKKQFFDMYGYDLDRLNLVNLVKEMPEYKIIPARISRDNIGSAPGIQMPAPPKEKSPWLELGPSSKSRVVDKVDDSILRILDTLYATDPKEYHVSVREEQPENKNSPLESSASGLASCLPENNIGRKNKSQKRDKFVAEDAEAKDKLSN